MSVAENKTSVKGRGERVAIFFGLASTVSVWLLIGLFSVWWVRTSRVCGDGSTISVSVLKPLCGTDPHLEANLRTFFEQDHPDYELLFGVEGPHDSAIDIVQRLREQYPHVHSRLVVHSGTPGFNPKVRNLRAIAAVASHDVLLISDSNIAAAPTYLREMAAAITQPGVELVTSLFRVPNGKTVASTIESLEFAGFAAGGIAASNLLAGAGTVVGKSLMFRRSTFDALGGFDSIAYCLAEDLIIGQTMARAGHGVHVAATPVDNVNPHGTLLQFYCRHLRWTVMRRVTVPLVWAIEPLSMPLALATTAPLFGVSWTVAFAWAIPATLLRDGVGWLLLQGPRGLLRALLLIPLRDVLHVGIWFMSIWTSRVGWRGRSLDVAIGSRLYVREASPPDTTVILPAPARTPAISLSGM